MAHHRVNGPALDVLPFIGCPFRLEAEVVDLGHGTPREIAAVIDRLPGAVALMNMAYEPFTTPVPHAYRLRDVAAAGAVAVAVTDPKSGERREYHSAHDTRDPDFPSPPLPRRDHHAGSGCQTTSYGQTTVVTRCGHGPGDQAHRQTCTQCCADRWPEEDLVFGGHHDIVYGTPSGNDNGSGTIATLETAHLCSRGAGLSGFLRIRSPTLRQRPASAAGHQSRRAVPQDT
jgi:hypothetical protein